MPITNTNLVDPFFEETEFIETAIYTPSGGSPASIPVFFDRENSVTPIGSVAIENAAPQALAKTSDVAGVNNKATLAIGGVTYYVKDVQPSAHGLTLLILSKYDK